MTDCGARSSAPFFCRNVLPGLTLTRKRVEHSELGLTELREETNSAQTMPNKRGSERKSRWWNGSQATHRAVWIANPCDDFPTEMWLACTRNGEQNFVYGNEGIACVCNENVPKDMLETDAETECEGG